MWRDGEMECVREKRGTKIEAQKEKRQEDRPLSRILNLPWCQGAPSCSPCQEISLSLTYTHTQAYTENGR